MYNYRVGDLVKIVGEHRLYLITMVLNDERKCQVKYIHGRPETEVGKVVDFCDIFEVVDHFDVTK